MVEIKNGSLIVKKKKIENINAIFSNGDNHIEFNDKYLFNLLTLTSGSLDNGQLLIDGSQDILTIENEKKFIFAMRINSKVINLIAFFLLNDENKKEKISTIKEALESLTNYPLNYWIEKKTKIESIFAILKSFNVSYMLIDTNDDINVSNEDLINEAKTTFINDVCFISLDRKKTEVEYDALVIGSSSDNKKEATHFNKTLETLKVAFKQNIWLNIFSFIEKILLFAYAFCLQNVLNNSEPIVFTVILIALIATFVLLAIIDYRSFDFLDKNNNEETKLLYKAKVIELVISTLLAALIAVGIMVLLGNFNVLIDIKTFKGSEIITFITIYLLLNCFIIFIKQIKSFIKKLRKK